MDNQEHSIAYEIIKDLKTTNKKLVLSNIGLIIIIMLILIKVYFL